MKYVHLLAHLNRKIDCYFKIGFYHLKRLQFSHDLFNSLNVAAAAETPYNF